jgi:hypothetical protein
MHSKDWRCRKRGAQAPASPPASKQGGDLAEVTRARPRQSFERMRNADVTARLRSHTLNTTRVMKLLGFGYCGSSKREN